MLSLSHKLIKSIRRLKKKNELIGGIVFDKMTTRKAAKKVNISESFAYHYHKRTKKQYSNISVPRPMDHNKYCTQIQINTLISCLVDDNISLTAASEKVNVGRESGGKYY
jgi:transposase